VQSRSCSSILVTVAEPLATISRTCPRSPRVNPRFNCHRVCKPQGGRICTRPIHYFRRIESLAHLARRERGPATQGPLFVPTWSLRCPLRPPSDQAGRGNTQSADHARNAVSPQQRRTTRTQHFLDDGSVNSLAVQNGTAKPEMDTLIFIFTFRLIVSHWPHHNFCRSNASPIRSQEPEVSALRILQSVVSIRGPLFLIGGSARPLHRCKSGSSPGGRLWPPEEFHARVRPHFQYSACPSVNERTPPLLCGSPAGLAIARTLACLGVECEQAIINALFVLTDEGEELDDRVSWPPFCCSTWSKALSLAPRTHPASNCEGAAWLHRWPWLDRRAAIDASRG